MEDRTTRAAQLAALARLGLPHSPVPEPSPLLVLDDAPPRPVPGAFGTASPLEAVVEERQRELFARTQELNEALDALKRNQAKLVEAEKQASLAGLVAGMAHELNTPIGTALTAATALGDAAARVTEQVERHALRRSDLMHFLKLVGDVTPLILGSLNRSVGLIDSFKRLAVGGAGEERRRFDLRRRVEQALVGFAPKARRDGHRLTSACPAGIGMDGYPDLLGQVLSALVQNALLHGLSPDRPGAVAILAREDGDTVELRCVDDGRGIDPEHLDRIFDPFFTTGRGKGAAGLGLNVVHNAVTRVLGGTVRVDSEPGLGTTVSLRLPRRAPCPDESALLADGADA
ncbi:MAG TPA: HAMP domain-containing sensor histidine kinase [Azospirillum sp.]|nr:HAMP domain-containing sensor histidine kinase [Azospirillum sp.]